MHIFFGLVEKAAQKKGRGIVSFTFDDREKSSQKKFHQHIIAQNMHE